MVMFGAVPVKVTFVPAVKFVDITGVVAALIVIPVPAVSLLVKLGYGMSMFAEPLNPTPAIFLLVANAVAVSARTAVEGLRAIPPTKYPPETFTFPVILNL
jgi:hypothetical protein